MKTVALPKAYLGQFATALQQFGELHAPVSVNGRYAFRPLNEWSEACLEYTRTILPPKKYLLPPLDTLFHYRPGEGYIPATDGLDRQIVLFGVHACDITAINILDGVFAGRFPDPYYQTRRSNLAVIGIDCVPDEHCFCRSMRSGFVDQGFDLFLYDVGDRYLTFVGTAKGDDMVMAVGPLFEEESRADIEEYKRRSEEKRSAFQLDVEMRDMSGIFEMEYESAIWEDLGKRCLECGSCSMVCPTCYCYDVVDRAELGTGESVRQRCWDSCLFSTHASVAGGENFRESRASRIKFRFYHKQRGFVAEYGRPSCVGCGRCIEVCPVGIDIVQVLSALRGVRHAHSG